MERKAWPTCGAHIVFLASLCLLSFVLATRTVAFHSGDPELGGLTDKLRYFTAHKDRYDMVFVGSSRIKRGIIPAELDAQLAARGLPVCSFNFGVAGMEPHLASVVIRRLLATEPVRLRWLVVELGEWDYDLPAANRFKRRTIFWHDSIETRSVVRSMLRVELPIADKADLLTTHVMHFAARAAGAGRGPDLIRRLWTGAEAIADMPGQGFEPFSARAMAEPSTHPMRRRFQRDLARYPERVERLASYRPSPSARSRGYHLEALRAQSDLIRRHGVEPLSLITPILRPTPELDSLAGQGRIPHLLSFNDPNRYPELYAVENRFDHEHLTEPGARALTGHVARHFAAAVGARRAPAELVALHVSP